MARYTPVLRVDACGEWLEGFAAGWVGGAEETLNYPRGFATASDLKFKNRGHGFNTSGNVLNNPRVGSQQPAGICYEVSPRAYRLLRGGQDHDTIPN